MIKSNRRQFLATLSAAGMATLLPGATSLSSLRASGDFVVPADSPRAKIATGIKFGLCTYQWGANADLPTLIDWCEKGEMDGLELRCKHAHGVEPTLTAAERAEVKKRFADTPVTFIGLGTNEDFHYVDQDEVKAHIEQAKAYVKLSYDCGGLGIKVKPNALPKEVSQQKTTSQIAAALEELGKFAADYGQVIRLENHGDCSPVPIMKEIIDQVTAPNVGLCWNCNGCDKDAPGVEAFLKSVRNRLGDTVHLHEFDMNAYPYDELMRYLVASNYNGWLLYEAGNKVDDVPGTMKSQKADFLNLLS